MNNISLLPFEEWKAPELYDAIVSPRDKERSQQELPNQFDRRIRGANFFSEYSKPILLQRLYFPLFSYLCLAANDLWQHTCR
jgi:hypothetical protein